jgi:hypothetical protein
LIWQLLQSQVHVHPRRAPTPIEQMQRQLYMRHIPAEVYPHLAHFRMSDRNQDRIVEYFRHARPRNLQNDVEIQQAFHNLAAVGVRPGMLAQHYREQPIDVIREILGRPTSPDRILALPESGEVHINRQMLTLAWDHLRDVYPDLPPLSAFEAEAGGSGTGGSSAAMGPGKIIIILDLPSSSIFHLKQQAVRAALLRVLVVLRPQWVNVKL